MRKSRIVTVLVAVTCVAAAFGGCANGSQEAASSVGGAGGSTSSSSGHASSSSSGASSSTSSSTSASSTASSTSSSSGAGGMASASSSSSGAGGMASSSSSSSGAGGAGAAGGAGGAGGGPVLFCMGNSNPQGFLSPCAKVTQDCAPGASCTASPNGAMFTTCTASQCDAVVNGISDAIACKDKTTCTVNLSGIDFCATCGKGATCDFTDNGSAGGQEYFCEAGSKCNVHIKGSSGGRIVHCSTAASCTVDVSASGDTLVECPADCTITGSGGISETCCPNQMPTACPNGKLVCDPNKC